MGDRARSADTTGNKTAKREIHFQVLIAVENLSLPESRPLVASGNASGFKTRVELRQATTEEMNEGPGATLCEAIVRANLPEKAMETFQVLWDHHLGIAEAPSWAFFLDAVPGSARDLVLRTWHLAHEELHRLLGLAAWRSAALFPMYHRRLRQMGFSFDRRTWAQPPMKLVVPQQPGIFLAFHAFDEIERLYVDGSSEPLPHQLLREAWNLRSDAPNSSLVMGVSALEAAVKELISALAPETTWLIREMPSPPVVQLLTQYVPILIQPMSFRPSEDIGKVLTKRNKDRNDLVHGKAVRIEPRSLEDYLLLVRDLTFVCDFLRGVSWALGHVRPETISQLGLSSLNSTPQPDEGHEAEKEEGQSEADEHQRQER